MQKARHTGSCRDKNGELEVKEVIGHKMGQQVTIKTTCTFGRWLQNNGLCRYIDSQKVLIYDDDVPVLLLGRVGRLGKGNGW